MAKTRSKVYEPLKKAQKKYAQTEKGKAAFKRYITSEQGKEARRRATQKYEASEKGKARADRYKGNKEERMPYAKLLSRFIKKYNKLPNQLAAELGVTRSSVSNWINAKSGISDKNQDKLIEIFGGEYEYELNLIRYKDEE